MGIEVTFYNVGQSFIAKYKIGDIESLNITIFVWFSSSVRNN